MAVENVPHADIVEQLDCMTGTRARFGDAASCRWYGKRVLVLDPTLSSRLTVDRLKRKWRPVQKKTTLSLPAEVVPLQAAEIMGKCLRTELLDPNTETERSCNTVYMDSENKFPFLSVLLFEAVIMSSTCSGTEFPERLRRDRANFDYFVPLCSLQSQLSKRTRRLSYQPGWSSID